MNDEPLMPQDLTVAPPVAGALPSGIRFGLHGSLDADDMARRALGSVSYADPLPDEPESVPPYEPPDESFAFVEFRKGADGGAEEGKYFANISGGKIKLSDADVTVPDTEIEFTGTVSAPSYISLRLKLSDNTYEIRDEHTDPVNDENYHWYVLHVVYIHTGGRGIYVKDRRPDWKYSVAEDAHDYPWKVTVTELSPNNYQRSTQKGSWTRNTEFENTLLTLTTPDVGIVNDGNYVFAFIGRSDLDKDPRLFPTVVGTNHSSNTTKAAVAGILAALTPPVYYGGHVVLGKLTAGVWEQYWTGGDITDYLEVMDSDTVNHVPSGERHTIERNPSTGERKGELQLFDCDTAVGDKNVPLLSVVDPLATPVVRELEWPAIDSHGGAGISTLEVANPGANKVLSIMNANGVSAAGKHMGYLWHSGVIKEFKFAAIDTHEVPSIGKSIEVEGGEAEDDGRMQIHNWQTATGDCVTFSAGTHDALLGRIATGKEAVLIKPDSLPYSPTDHNHDGDYAPIDHTHDHGELTGLDDDDHPQYLKLDGTAERNAMSGEIGDGSGVQSIDPTARTLDGASGLTIGWKVTSDKGIEVDDFETGALVVAGGVSVGKDLQVDEIAFADTLQIASTADGTPVWSIKTNGGILADGHVRAEVGFSRGTKDGITKNVSWEDVNGQVHTLEITGGIITGHTVA